MRLVCLCLFVLMCAVGGRTIKLSKSYPKRRRIPSRKLMLGSLMGGGGGGGMMPNNDLLKEQVAEKEKEIDDIKEWMRQKRGTLISDQHEDGDSRRPLGRAY